MAKFEEILAELRKDKGLSQKALAKAFHVSGSTISSYETGVHSPDIDQIIQFANFFDVRTDYLLGHSYCDISPTILTKPFVDDTLIQDVLMMMEELPEEHRRAIVLLINEITLGIAMRERAKYPLEKKYFNKNRDK